MTYNRLFLGRRARRRAWRRSWVLTAACAAAIAGSSQSAVAVGWVNVPGSTPGELQSVSCVTATDCFAVGYITFTSANGYTSRAARWDGMRWTVQPSPPTPVPQFNGLNGVSCTSESSCTAVGDDSSPGSGTSPLVQTTIAEQWNGTSWTIQPTMNQTGANDTVLAAVSCPSATSCIAVGWYQPAIASSNGPSGTGEPIPFSEGWNGSSWESLPTPGVGSMLGGVSCTSPTACTAVGTNGPDALIERWDGSSWSVQEAATPNGSHGDILTGVSCTSPTACTAVGSYNPTAQEFPEAPLAERWDGSNWTVQTTPVPGGITGGPLAPNGGFLQAVSCLSALDCVAAGSSTRRQGFGETWDGAGWTFQPFPGPDSAALALSCGSPTTCLAVGGGLSNTTEIYSTLMPTNRFTIGRIKLKADGTITLTLKLPGTGSIDVLATAWDDNFAPAVNLASSATLQPAVHRFAFGRLHLIANQPGTLTAAMPPNARGRALVRHHRYRVTLRLWVTYTPTGGRPRTIGLRGLHPPACSDPDNDQDCHVS